MTTKTKTTVTKTKTRKHASATMVGFKALVGEGQGVFEAIVSVFGNVDYGGDRVTAGAFADSLEQWKSSGDPIPVIFSHQWDTLPAHIGEVTEAKELFPGDEQLPESIRANGGLYVKARLDVEDSATWAPTVWRLMARRTLREFSFAYDVLDERKASDGANDLVQLDLIEVGPTLKGMNPATALIDTKSLEKDVKFSHPFMAGVDDAARCLICGQTRSTLPHLNQLSDDGQGDGNRGTKAWVWIVVPGSYEERQDLVNEEVTEWAIEQLGTELYDAYVEATFDDHVIFYVEAWADALGEGSYYQAAYTVGPEDDGDGDAYEVTLGDVTEVELSAVPNLTAKARRKSRFRRLVAGGASSRAASASGTVPPKPPTKSEGKAEDPVTGKAEDSMTRDRALLELELLDLS